MATQLKQVFPSITSVSSVFVATWDHVGYYNKNIDKKNTFQTIIAVGEVNGKPHSFVIFNYLDNGIQWTFGDASRGVHAQCGFNKGDGNTYASIQGSYSEDIISIDKTSNIGVAGRFIYQIDGEVIAEPGQDATDHPLFRSDIEKRILTNEKMHVYDAIYNANRSFIKDITTHNGLITFMNNPNVIDENKDALGGRVCAVGPYDAGI